MIEWIHNIKAAIGNYLLKRELQKKRKPRGRSVAFLELRGDFLHFFENRPQAPPSGPEAAPAPKHVPMASI